MQLADIKPTFFPQIYHAGQIICLAHIIYCALLPFPEGSYVLFLVDVAVLVEMTWHDPKAAAI